MLIKSKIIHETIGAFDSTLLAKFELYSLSCQKFYILKQKHLNTIQQGNFIFHDHSLFESISIIPVI